MTAAAGSEASDGGFGKKCLRVIIHQSLQDLCQITHLRDRPVITEPVRVTLLPHGYNASCFPNSEKETERLKIYLICSEIIWGLRTKSC